jgi:hypothetical protein
MKSLLLLLCFTPFLLANAQTIWPGLIPYPAQATTYGPAQQCAFDGTTNNVVTLDLVNNSGFLLLTNNAELNVINLPTNTTLWKEYQLFTINSTTNNYTLTPSTLSTITFADDFKQPQSKTGTNRIGASVTNYGATLYTLESVGTNTLIHFVTTYGH